MEGERHRGVALNLIRRHLRDAKRHAERFSEYHPNVDNHAAPEPSPEECVQRIEAMCQRSNAAVGLTERETAVLLLHVVDGMSHKEIVAELEITECTSQKRYQRARNHMAECLDDEALCVMPPIETSCNDGSVPNDIASQFFDWGKWSHYSGQMAAAVLALLLFVPSSRPTQSRAVVTGEIRTSAAVAMYRFDKQNAAFDKPAAFSDSPRDKPQPASLPSVLDINASNKFVDKPTYVPRSAPLPPYKPTGITSAHLPLGR